MLKMFQQSDPKPFLNAKHILAVAAGKGGVGKSTVTVNLALALHQMGFSVGIMDTDVYGPSIRKMLPEDRMPSQNGASIIPALCQGIRMMSMAYFRKDNEAAAVRAPIANGLIQQFIRNVEWGDLDYLLIDFPPGTGDIQLTLCQQANLTGALMVTTPQDVATLDVRKAMHLFEQLRVPIVGIVENMSYYYHEATRETLYLFGKGGGERLAHETGAAFLGSIPIDPAVSFSGDKGTSLFSKENAEASHAAKAFLALAQQAVSQLSTMNMASEGHLKQFELVWKEMAEK